MNSPEREEVSRQLAKKFFWTLIENDTGNFYEDATGEYVDTSLADALISREMRVRELEQALRLIHDTFDKDLAAGYMTKDKTFARDIARLALNPKGEKG